MSLAKLGLLSYSSLECVTMFTFSVTPFAFIRRESGLLSQMLLPFSKCKKIPVRNAFIKQRFFCANELAC